MIFLSYDLAHFGLAAAFLGAVLAGFAVLICLVLAIFFTVTLVTELGRLVYLDLGLLAFANAVFSPMAMAAYTSFMLTPETPGEIWSYTE